MEVEVLDAEVKVGPSLGRVLGEKKAHIEFQLMLFCFKGWAR